MKTAFLVTNGSGNLKYYCHLDSSFELCFKRVSDFDSVAIIDLHIVPGLCCSFSSLKEYNPDLEILSVIPVTDISFKDRTLSDCWRVARQFGVGYDS